MLNASLAVAVSASLAVIWPAPPSESFTALSWTSTDISSPGGTWDSYTATAAAWSEGGFDDWRLPTVVEIQTAVQGGTFGQMAASASWLLWTSETQGHNYAWTVRVTTDANGDPIPSQSGQKVKVLKRSNLRAKFVRP